MLNVKKVGHIWITSALTRTYPFLNSVSGYHQHEITAALLPQTFTLMLVGLGMFGAIAQRRKQHEGMA